MLVCISCISHETVNASYQIERSGNYPVLQGQDCLLYVSYTQSMWYLLGHTSGGLRQSVPFPPVFAHSSIWPQVEPTVVAKSLETLSLHIHIIQVWPLQVNNNDISNLTHTIAYIPKNNKPYPVIMWEPLFGSSLAFLRLLLVSLCPITGKATHHHWFLCHFVREFMSDMPLQLLAVCWKKRHIFLQGTCYQYCCLITCLSSGEGSNNSKLTKLWSGADALSS